MKAVLPATSANGADQDLAVAAGAAANTRPAAVRAPAVTAAPVRN